MFKTFIIDNILPVFYDSIISISNFDAYCASLGLSAFLYVINCCGKYNMWLTVDCSSICRGDRCA